MNTNPDDLITVVVQWSYSQGLIPAINTAVSFTFLT